MPPHMRKEPPCPTCSTPRGPCSSRLGLLSSTLLLLDRPTLKTALLLALGVWGFARAYYFAFYVVERYVDPAYRFAGLASFARYVLVQRNRTVAPLPHADDERHDDDRVRRRPEERPAPVRTAAMDPTARTTRRTSRSQGDMNCNRSNRRKTRSRRTVP